MSSRWPGGRAESEERARKLRSIPHGSTAHLSGICGTGMAAVASLLKDLGFKIQGSDKAFYPPMGDVVRGLTDRIFEGYSAANLNPKPDFVVIGNNIRPDNPEAETVRKEGILFASMPEVFSALLIGTREFCPASVVVAGTHGKTTTTAAIATLLDKAGRRPGYFVGGVPMDLPGGVRAVDSSLPLNQRAVVLEGDEYDSAYFAKWSKFHSYRPDILIVTSLEFDHADIFNSIEEIEAEFLDLVRAVPAEGLILVCDTSERLLTLAKGWSHETKARIRFYGSQVASQYRITGRTPEETGQKLSFSLEGEPISSSSALSGEHNALNLLAASAVCRELRVPLKAISDALPQFHGVLRRQSVIASAGGVTLIEDFAHHPTAIRATLEGLRETYRPRRLVAAYEPRSNTARRSFHQQAYPASFSPADNVVFLEVSDSSGYSGTGQEIVPLDVSDVIDALRKGGSDAHSFGSVEEIERYLRDSAKSGDLIVCMTNGDFGGLVPRLKKALEQCEFSFQRK